jgi:hypothetical protein
METFSPIILYGYEVIVPSDGKFTPEDKDPDEDFLDDNVDDAIADMYLEYSPIGHYYRNIPEVVLPDNCGLCALQTNGTVAESETHRRYLKGNYGLFIGVIITPDMTMSEIYTTYDRLKQLMDRNQILGKLSVTNHPIFIAGADVSNLLI